MLPKVVVAVLLAAAVLTPTASARPSFDPYDGFVWVYSTGENGSTAELVPGLRAPNRK